MHSLRKLCLRTLGITTLCIGSTAIAEVKGPISLTIADVGTSEVLAWSWGASNSGSTQSGGGGGAGKAHFQDLSMTRYTDNQSAQLLQAVATGTHFTEVELKREGMRIVMHDVLLTSYSVGASNSKKDPQTENITFNFAKITYQLAGGDPYCFNIATNTPLQLIPHCPGLYAVPGSPFSFGGTSGQRSNENLCGRVNNSVEGDPDPVKAAHS